MATGDLCQLADLKLWPGIGGETDDAVLERLITAASAFIEQWLNRQLLTASYTETRDGHGERSILLRQWPVTAVGSVTIDGIVISPASGPPWSNGYVFDQKKLSLYDYRFCHGYSNVQLAYTAGYSAVPVDITQACIELCARKNAERTRIGMKSKSIAGEVISFIVSDLSPEEKALLLPYRRVAPL